MIVTVALGTVALFGFCAMAVDYGRSVTAKNTLQRACDAAALAGVAYLAAEYPTASTAADTAVVAARYYGYQNGVAVANMTIAVTNNNRITVSATRDVRYFFAPVMRILVGRVAARAVAAVQLRNGSTTLPNFAVPIGITPSTYAKYKDGSPANILGIRQNKTDLDVDEFVLFDLRAQNSKSPAHMQNQLQWGSTFNEPTMIGGSETTLNAANVSQAKKFEDGVNSRISAANQSPYYDNGTLFTSIPAGSPRLVYIIVTPEQQAVNGTNNAPVVGIVPAYIETITVDGSAMGMRLRFLPPDAGNVGVWTDADTNVKDNIPMRVARLVS